MHAAIIICELFDAVVVVLYLSVALSCTLLSNAKGILYFPVSNARRQLL